MDYMESNNMNPDQTAPCEQYDLGPCCLPYRLPENINQMRGADNKSCVRLVGKELFLLPYSVCASSEGSDETALVF